MKVSRPLPVKELSACHQLKDEGDLRGGLKDLFQFDLKKREDSLVPNVPTYAKVNEE